MPSNVTLAERFKAVVNAIKWIYDRASWRHDLSAVSGTKPEVGRQDAALH